jgi:hypothetical protein
MKAVRRGPNATKMMRKRLERTAYMPCRNELIGCKHRRTACRPSRR